MSELLELIFTTVFSEYGLIGISFISVLSWTMRENRDRENKYQETIQRNQDIILEQAKNFDIVKEIREDVADLKGAMINRKK